MLSIATSILRHLSAKADFVDIEELCFVTSFNTNMC